MVGLCSIIDIGNNVEILAKCCGYLVSKNVGIYTGSLRLVKIVSNHRKDEIYTPLVLMSTVLASC